MKLTNKIHLLRIDFDITISSTQKIPRYVNVLIIFGDKITLIDTGVKGSEKLIFDYVLKNGRKISEIDTIILSHSHPDHIGSAALIKEKTQCKIWAHKLEQEWIENIEKQNNERPVPGFFELVEKSVSVDGFLKNNEIVKLTEDVTIQLTCSPGHSKGMLNVLFVEDKILFTADSIPLKGDIPNYDSYIELLSSLDKIRNNKSYSILLTSWTPPLTNYSEIDDIISEGKKYIDLIDTIVKKHYCNNKRNSLEACQQVINELSLPPFFFLVNPIIDKAFRSHLMYI